MRLAGQTPFQVCDQLPRNGVIVTRDGRFRGQSLGQGLPQFLDARVAADDRLAKRSLLAIQARLQLGVVGFQLAEPPDVGTIGRADQVRQHVHFAERVANHAMPAAGCVSVAQ